MFVFSLWLNILQTKKCLVFSYINISKHLDPCLRNILNVFYIYAKHLPYFYIFFLIITTTRYSLNFSSFFLTSSILFLLIVNYFLLQSTILAGNQRQSFAAIHFLWCVLSGLAWKHRFRVEEVKNNPFGTPDKVPISCFSAQISSYRELFEGPVWLIQTAKRSSCTPKTGEPVRMNRIYAYFAVILLFSPV